MTASEPPRRARGVWLISTLLFLLCIAVIGWLSGFAGLDLSRDDEAAHFVNGLLIHDYVLHAFGRDPIAYAIDYYTHFPRVSIGHWPPAFHILEAVSMMVAGRSEAAAKVLQMVIAAALCGTVTTVVAKRHGLLLGAVAGLVVLAEPLVMYYASAVMVDNAVALLVLLAALAWARYAATQDWRWSVAFGAVSAAAMLTKGNALGLGLLPAIYCGLARDLRILRSWKTWLAPLVVVPPVAIWYAATYRISADGFNYPFGWAFTGIALPYFGLALFSVLGLVAPFAFAAGLVSAMARPDGRPRDDVRLSMAALTLALFCFTVLIPTNITERYLLVIVPPVIVLAVTGLCDALALLLPRLAPRTRAAITVAALAVPAALIAEVPLSLTLRMDQASEAIISSGANGPLVMVAATANGEGGVIAAFAAHGDMAWYVVRGSKLLSSSNFMGKDYQPRFADEAGAAAWLRQSPIGWIVLEDTPASLDYEHNRQVAAALSAPGSGWRIVGRFPVRFGETRVYRRDIAPPSPAELAPILKAIAPTKIIGGDPAARGP